MSATRSTSLLAERYWDFFHEELLSAEEKEANKESIKEFCVDGQVQKGFWKRAVDAVFMSVIRQTREIGSSKLAGLMTFRLKTTGSVRPKYWRNPATKIWYELPEKPARKTAFVKPTKKFKRLLN